MKIQIKNAYNTYNYGTMMMCENLIHFLNEKIHNITFFIEGGNNSNISRLKEATKQQNIKSCPFPINKYFFTKGPLKRMERKIRTTLAKKLDFTKYDVVIVLGGDDFAETYAVNEKGLKIALQEIKNIEKLNNKTNLYMIGQTIGPYTGKRKEYASRVFKKVKIYCRDETSREYMKKELGIEGIPSRDLALLDLTRQEEFIKNKKEVLNQYHLEENGYITIVGTGLLYAYTNKKEDFLTTFLEIIKEINEKYPDKKIVWLSHVTTPNHPSLDNTCLVELEKIEKGLSKYITMIKDPILPVEARIILGNGYFTITCRMHAAVSTFQMGRPAICLSYSQKYNGVIARGLNMPELVIEAKGDSIWQTKEICKLIKEKTDDIDSHYLELTNRIQHEVQKGKQIVNQTLEEIANQILMNQKQ